MRDNWNAALGQIAEIVTPKSYKPYRFELKNKLLRWGGLEISEGVAIDTGFEYFQGHQCKIKIGANSVIGKNLKLFNYGPITIGRFCMFAADVSLVNGSHQLDNYEPFSEHLNIGNGCWIGYGAKIVGGVTIGDNAVIGAGALVVNDVPSSTVVAGVPARPINKRVPSSRVWCLGNRHYSSENFELIP